MDVVVVGGGYAGAACALRLASRARRARLRLRIRLVNPSERFVERIRLHQQLAGQALPERSLRALLSRAGVELVLGTARAVDPVARTVHLDRETLRFDRLVVALGSRPATGATPGAEEHALTLSAPQVRTLADRLAALPTGAVVAVVGGGLGGIETAAELAERYPRLAVHLVTRGRVAGELSEAARHHLARTFDRLDVVVHENVEVTAVERDGLLAAQGRLRFDLCVWTAGFAFPSLPGTGGLAVNARGQVLVDPQLRSISYPHVYAAGDIAAPVLDPGQALPLGCKTAQPTGAHVADTLVAEMTQRALPPFDYALPFYCASLGRRDGLIQKADANGRLTGTVMTGRRAAWFKEAVCRSTWWALALEARGLPAIAWPRTGRAPGRLPVPREAAAA